MLVRGPLHKLDGHITREAYFRMPDMFFDIAIDYINEWGKHLDNLHNLNCLLLRTIPGRNDFQRAVETLQTKCPILNINIDLMFYEFTYMKDHLAMKWFDKPRHNNVAEVERNISNA